MMYDEAAIRIEARRRLVNKARRCVNLILKDKFKLDNVQWTENYNLEQLVRLLPIIALMDEEDLEQLKENIGQYIDN